MFGKPTVIWIILLFNLVIESHSDKRRTRRRGWQNDDRNYNYRNGIGNNFVNDNLCSSQFECLQSFIIKNEDRIINDGDDTYTICVWWDTNPQCDVDNFEILYNNNKINQWFNSYENKICQFIKCGEQITFNIGNDGLSCSNSKSLLNVNINSIEANCIGIDECNDCQWTLFAPQCIVDTKTCDSGFLIKNATFLLDISGKCKNTEENGDKCAAFQQEIATFEKALHSVNTSPKVTLSTRLSSLFINQNNLQGIDQQNNNRQNSNIFVSLEYDICYDKSDTYMVILYDVSAAKSTVQCIKQQKQIADTIQALIRNSAIIIEYIEFDINTPDYEFSLKSDDDNNDTEIGNVISFYQKIINRSRELCDEDRPRPRPTINNTQASDAFSDILGSAVLKLTSQPTAQKKLLIFNDNGLDETGEDDVCSQYSPYFDLIGLPPSPPPTPPPAGSTSPSPLPQPPANVNFNGNYRIIIDWTLSAYDPQLLDIVSPVISLPTDILIDSGVPIYDGEFIFPTQFCGLRIIKADRFIWFINNQAQTDPIDDFPFNYIAEDESVNSIFGPNEYYGGIQFSGPIGKCREDNNPWAFGTPWLQGPESPPSVSQLKLVIEVSSGATIQFIDSINELNEDGFLLDPWELWEEHEIKDICEQVPEFCEFDAAEFCEKLPEFCEDDNDDDDNDNNQLIDALIINNELLDNGNPSSYLSCLVGVGRISDRVRNRLFVNKQNFEKTLDLTADDNDNKYNIINNDVDDFLTYFNRIIIPQIQYETCRKNENTNSQIIDSFRDNAQSTRICVEFEFPPNHYHECCWERHGFLNWSGGCDTLICPECDE